MMDRFTFEVYRSNDDDDQAVGVTCSRVEIQAYVDSRSVSEVREWARRLMVIPGVYSLRIRKVTEREWMEFGPYDTRKPCHKPPLKKKKPPRKRAD